MSSLHLVTSELVAITEAVPPAFELGVPVADTSWSATLNEPNYGSQGSFTDFYVIGKGRLSVEDVPARYSDSQGFAYPLQLCLSGMFGYYGYYGRGGTVDSIPFKVPDASPVGHEVAKPGSPSFKANFLRPAKNPIGADAVPEAFGRRYPTSSDMTTTGDIRSGVVTFSRSNRQFVFVKGSKFVVASQDEGGFEVDNRGRILIRRYGGLQDHHLLESRMSERPSSGNTSIIQSAVDAIWHGGETLARLVEKDRAMINDAVDAALAAKAQELGRELTASERQTVTLDTLAEKHADRVLAGGFALAIETELIAIIDPPTFDPDTITSPEVRAALGRFVPGEQAPIAQDELNKGTIEEDSGLASGPQEVLAKIAAAHRRAQAYANKAFDKLQEEAGIPREFRLHVSVVSLSNPWTGTHTGTRANIDQKDPKAEYVTALTGTRTTVGSWVYQTHPRTGESLEIRAFQAVQEGFNNWDAVLESPDVDPGTTWDLQSAQINEGHATCYNPSTGRYEVNERVPHAWKHLMASRLGAIFKIAAMSGGYTKGAYPAVTHPRTGLRVYLAGYREAVHNDIGTAGWQAIPGTVEQEFDNLVKVLTSGTTDRVARAAYYEVNVDPGTGEQSLRGIMHNVARDRVEEVNVDGTSFRSIPSARVEIVAPGNAMHFTKGTLGALAQIFGFLAHYYALVSDEYPDFVAYLNYLIKIAGVSDQMTGEDFYGREGEQQQQIVEEANRDKSASKLLQDMLDLYDRVLNVVEALKVQGLREVLPVARGLVASLRVESATLEEFAATAKGNLGTAVLNDLMLEHGYSADQAFQVIKAMQEAELAFIEGRDLDLIAGLPEEQRQILLGGDVETIARNDLTWASWSLLNLSETEKTALMDANVKSRIPDLLALRRQECQERRRGYFFRTADVRVATTQSTSSEEAAPEHAESATA